MDEGESLIRLWLSNIVDPIRVTMVKSEEVQGTRLHIGKHNKRP